MTAPLPTVESPRAPSGTGQQRRRPRWWLLALAVAAVLALTAALTVLLTGGDQPDEGAGPPSADDAVESAPGDDAVEPAPGDDAVEPEPHVRYEEEPPANWDVTGVPAGDVLDIRTGPGVGYPATATLPPNTVELESTGRIAYVDGVLWREIKVPGATTGWAHGRYLTEHRPPEGVDQIGIGLPAPAMTTAREIFIQARRGDLPALAGLALDGGRPFTASFGDEVTTPPQLVGLWEQIGREEVLRAMLALVALPDWYETSSTDAAGEQIAIFVTPRFMHEPTSANRAALEQQLSAAEVEASIADGQWLGWRLGITADGDWLFFVKGD
jgi:hypothetical protein